MGKEWETLDSCPKEESRPSVPSWARMAIKGERYGKPIGRQAVDAMKRNWLTGNFSKLWVYPDGSNYAMSDDYITFYAAKEGQPDFLPCFILGETEDSRVEPLQGPIQVSDVRKALGFGN